MPTPPWVFREFVRAVSGDKAMVDTQKVLMSRRPSDGAFLLTRGDDVWTLTHERMTRIVGDYFALLNIPATKCDGNHAGPRCADPECWNNDSPEPADLEHAIASALNKFSAENWSNTPDFILAQYLLGCLAAWNAATSARETWYGRDPQLIGGSGPAPVNPNKE